MSQRPYQSLKWPLTADQVEWINRMFETLFKEYRRGGGTTTYTENSLVVGGGTGESPLVPLSAGFGNSGQVLGSLGGGNEPAWTSTLPASASGTGSGTGFTYGGSVQYNNSGTITGDNYLIWDYNTQTLKVRDSGGGTFSVHPVGSFNYVDFILGGYHDSTDQYIPDSTQFTYQWNFANQKNWGLEVMWNETAGVVSPFSNGVGLVVQAPKSGNTQRGIQLYEYGGIGTGATESQGLGVHVGRNTAGNGAAGYLALQDRGGTYGYMWKDDNNIWRLAGGPPTEDNSTVPDAKTPEHDWAARNFRANPDGYIIWQGSTEMSAPADGDWLLTDTASTDFGQMMFGGTTSSYPSLKRSSAGLQVRLADDSGYTTIDASLYKAGGTSGISTTFQTTTRDITVTGGIITANAAGGSGGGGGVSDADYGDITVSSSGTVWTIDNDVVTNAKAANMAQSTIKGRAVGAGTGDPTDLTATQATALLDAFTGDSGAGGVKGLVPAPAAGDAAASKFLKADGTWTAVSASGGGAGFKDIFLLMGG